MTHTAFRFAAALAPPSATGSQAAPPAPAQPCLTPAALRAIVADKMPLAMSSMSACVV